MTDTPTPINPADLTDETVLMGYVEELLKLRTDLKLTPEEFPRVQTAILNELHETLNSHMIGLLTEADQKELHTYLDTDPTDAELFEFFGKKIPNLQAEITAVLINFRMAYLAPVLGQQQTVQPGSAKPEPDEEIIPAPPVPEAQQKPVHADFPKEVADLKEYLSQAKTNPATDPLLSKDVPDKQWN